MERMVICRTCGEEIAASAKVCPKCGGRNKQPIFKKWWFWAIVVVVVFGAIGSRGSGETVDSGTNNSAGGGAPEREQSSVSTEEKVSVFSGDCGISAVAEMGTDIIGQPTLSVSVTNLTEKRHQRD